MNIDNWIKSIIDSKERHAIPIMTNPGIELINRTIKEAVTNGEIHAEAICKLNDQYPASASTVIMDLTVEAEAFGCSILFSDDEVPNVTGRLVYDKTSVENLQIPSLTTGRVQEYLKANRITAQEIQDKPVFAGCIGPFSLAGRLYGLSELMMAIFIEPNTVELLLEKCTTFLIDYCSAIKATGANGVIIAEPAAGLISNEDCWTYSSAYLRNIIDTVQDETFLVILHNCGNTGHCTEAMIKSGAKALHFGNRINMTEALSACPDNILVMGNLDPVSIFKQSSATDIKQATTNLLTDTAGWPNFVLSSGCDVPPHTPFENIEAFYKALIDYNKGFI